MQAKDVSKQLAQRAPDVVKNLFRDGRKMGNEWCVGNIQGDAGDSLKIHLTGNKAGVWCDFATGDSGDLLDLWALKRNLTLATALKECCDYLGIGKPVFERYKQPKTFSRPTKTHFNSLTEISPIMEYLTKERKLTLETINAFQITQRGRDIVFPYIRESETVFVKYLSLDRPNGKKQVRVETNCEPSLFGWHLINPRARKLAICEGEIDAMSLYQLGIPALSVPFGAGDGAKHEWLEYEYERLAIFDEIFICMDNDEEGKKANRAIIDRLGAYRCRLVELPFKDPNDCLLEGIDAATMNCFFEEAISLDPQELKKTNYFLSEVINSFYPPGGIEPGYTPPWSKVEGKILFRPNELSIWGGMNGHGKSQFLGQIMLNIHDKGAKICIASLELKSNLLIKRLFKQASGLPLPSVEFINAIDSHYDNIWLFDLVGNMKAKRLLEIFQYARHRYGIDVFVIDSLMTLDIAEDDYKGQKSFIEKLCEFKNHNNCQVHLVVHPRKGANETTMPGKLDYKGTGAISDLADNCFTLWRNKAKEQALEKQNRIEPLSAKEMESLSMPDAFWFCDKQRHGEWEGSIGLWYDKYSGQYMPGESSRPKPLVNFSCLNR